MLAEVRYSDRVRAPPLSIACTASASRAGAYSASAAAVHSVAALPPPPTFRSCFALYSRCCCLDRFYPVGNVPIFLALSLFLFDVEAPDLLSVAAPTLARFSLCPNA